MASRSWIVSQLGAREHYAVPRALFAYGSLDRVFTDFWLEPDSISSTLPIDRRIRDRYHPELASASVDAFNCGTFAFEILQKVRKVGGWQKIVARNHWFQNRVLGRLNADYPTDSESRTLFSYSYASRDLFRWAKERGWTTVLGQIDPGPEEERIVAEEHRRYEQWSASWRPAPPSYWDSWREEIAMADRVVVNSAWSEQCLRNETVTGTGIEVVPLCFDSPSRRREHERRSSTDKVRFLFLGNICLRKGVARLLDAMGMLRDDPVELIMAGPSELSPDAWRDLPNVKWVGPVARSEVGRWYSRADVFVLPTLSDGFALTQLESLAHGTPVLASKNCGKVVTPGVNGWILDDLEPETIRDAIVMASRDYAELGAELVLPRFGLADLAAALERR